MFNDYKRYAANEDDIDRTEELEDEEQLDEDDEDDEDEPMKSDGQLLYEYLKSLDLVEDGAFEHLTQALKTKWEEAAHRLDNFQCADLGN